MSNSLVRPRSPCAAGRMLTYYARASNWTFLYRVLSLMRHLSGAASAPWLLGVSPPLKNQGTDTAQLREVSVLAARGISLRRAPDPFAPRLFGAFAPR